MSSMLVAFTCMHVHGINAQIISCQMQAFKDLFERQVFVVTENDNVLSNLMSTMRHVS